MADSESTYSGVGWIKAVEWVPYQRETFVTPPFAGYTSGHSTFSRAGAEVLTAFTGDAYFPGGMGTFTAPANDYLEFEQGPSEDITRPEASSGPLAILDAILKLAARDRLVCWAERWFEGLLLR